MWQLIRKMYYLRNGKIRKRRVKKITKNLTGLINISKGSEGNYFTLTQPREGQDLWLEFIISVRKYHDFSLSLSL